MIAFTLYVNTFTAGYVWDDRAAVVGNSDVVGGDSIMSLFLHDFWGQDITSASSHKSYRPMTTLSFRLNYFFHGLQPAGYHVGNVIIYGVCVVLFYWLSIRWISREGSIVASLFFCLHPVHVEGVASLVGRADSLCGLFMLLALLLYTDGLAYTHTDSQAVVLKGIVMLGAAFFCAFCGALSKEIGITCFGVFVVLEVIYFSAQLQEQQYPRKASPTASSNSSSDFHPVATRGIKSWLRVCDERTRYLLSKEQHRQKQGNRASYRSGKHGVPTPFSWDQLCTQVKGTVSTLTAVARRILRVWFPALGVLGGLDRSKGTAWLVAVAGGSAEQEEDEVSSVGSIPSTSSGSTNGGRRVRTPVVTPVNALAACIRVGCSVLSLVVILVGRFILHGDHQLYTWTIMENNISLMPFLSHRILSYAQTHYFYLLKLFNPITPHLCFDYGYACLPEIRSVWTPANILPLLAYALILYVICRGVVQCRRSLLLALSILIITLLPALNILFPVGTLLAERLMFMPSVGVALLVGEVFTVDLLWVWEALSEAGYGRDLCTLGLPVTSWKEVMSSSRRSETSSAPRSTPSAPWPHPSIGSAGPEIDGVENDGGGLCLADTGTRMVTLQKPWVCALLTVCMPILVVMAARVVLRNYDWRNEANLYRSALAVCPRSVKGLNNNGMLQLALGHAEEALAVNERWVPYRVDTMTEHVYVVTLMT